MGKRKGCKLSLLVLLISGIAFAEWGKSDLSPVYTSRSLNVFSVYISTGRQDTSTYGVFETSIQFKSTGGLYAGTTGFALTDYTIDQFINYMSRISSITVGIEGGLVIAKSANCYGTDTLERLTKTNYANIKGIANKKTVTQTDANGIGHVVSKDYLDSDQLFCITDILVNATFASGKTYFDVYNGSSTDNTRIRHEQISTSGTDAQINIPPSGYFKGLENKSMLFQLYCSTNITDGYINYTGFRK